MTSNAIAVNSGEVNQPNSFSLKSWAERVDSKSLEDQDTALR